MIKKSTPKSITHYGKTSRQKSEEPSESTLNFLKLYARCCHIEKTVASPLDKVCLN
jgi:hypothetical protein